MKTILLLLSFFVTAFHLHAQNVGIGNTSPQYPLSFNGNLGDKISLWTDGSATHYGMGVQSGLLQIFAKTAADDLAFGYGSSNAFTEVMRVKGNGNVGIGNLNPGFRLDLTGRMRIRTGVDGEAGIWLNNFANTSVQSFIGLENNNYVGFYGATGAGWSFGMNTNNGNIKMMGMVGIGTATPNAPLTFPAVLGKKITLYPGATGDVGIGVSGNRLYLYSDNPNADVAFGYDAAGVFNERFAIKPNGALALNGNIGSPGQVLQSNGNSAATWVSNTASTPQIITSGSLASCSNNGPAVDIPGLFATINLSAPARVAFYVSMNLKNQGCFGCGAGYTRIRVVPSAGGGTSFNTELMVITANYEWIGINTGPMIVDLPAGNHIYKVVFQDDVSNGSGAEAYTFGGTLIWQIFPQ